MIWTTASGQKIDIKDMENSHLLNCYRLECERKIDLDMSIRLLKKEIKKRNLAPFRPRNANGIPDKEIDRLFNQVVSKRIRNLKRDMY